MKIIRDIQKKVKKICEKNILVLLNLITSIHFN